MAVHNPGHFNVADSSYNSCYCKAAFSLKHVQFFHTRSDRSGQIFRAQGWMEISRIVQFWFILALIGTSVAILAGSRAVINRYAEGFMAALIGP
jgi:hypothetical protein